MGYLALASLALCGTGGVAGAGTLHGLVTDRDSGEELIAVDIVLVGIGLTVQTDLEGRYRLEALDPGTYSLRISYLGYQTRVIDGVTVEADEVRRLDIVLESFRANAIDDVMVTATRILSTEAAVLADRKRAAVVGDAISSAQISRSPDGQAGDALKRVTGMLVVDGGYVNVRGMPDRYNVTMIDGAVATSVDPDLDRKSFNFELIPSNLLASLQVLKTALPDMPGDFTGGLVRVNTVEFPEQPTTQMSLQTGFDTSAAGQDFYRDTYQGSTDWFGQDDGGRDRPRAMVDAGRLPNDGIPYPDEVAAAMPNRWATESTTTPLPLSFSLSHGNLFRPLGRKVGLVAAASYKSGASIGDELKTKHPELTNDRFESSDYLAEINIGALLNVNLELADGQRLSFKNLYGRNTEDSFLSAIKRDNALAYRYVLEWEEKDQLTSSVAGSHDLPPRGLALDWQLLYNENRAKEPDLRFVEYNLEAEPIVLLSNRRHWLYVSEYRRGLDTRLAWASADIDRPARLTLGIALSTRSRNLDHYPYNVARDGLSGGLVFLPPADIFAPENFKQGLFTLRYQDQFEASYRGSQVQNAYYAMVDVPLAVRQEEFRLAGGVRLENNRTAVAGFDKVTDQFIAAESYNESLLPSVNITYEYDEQTNLRLAYYRSLNYPEIREIAPVKSSDFKNDWQIVGNPDLQVARIANYDLRLERFPRAGEVLAASVFYKRIDDAIETSLNAQSNYLDLYSWFNGDGKNYGFELELRKRLDFLGRSLYDVTIAGNYTRIWSEVDFRVLESAGDDGQSAGFQDAVRLLQGQAPWVVNLSLNWDNPNHGTALTLLYNRIGTSLLSVSENPTFNRYAEPRHLFDVALTRRLSASTSLKVTARNIFGEDSARRFSVDRGHGGALPRELPGGYRTHGTALAMSLTAKF